MHMLPVNESSGAFCIKPKSHYTELKSCNVEEETLSLSNYAMPSSVSMEVSSPSSDSAMNTPVTQ